MIEIRMDITMTEYIHPNHPDAACTIGLDTLVMGQYMSTGLKVRKVDDAIKFAKLMLPGQRCRVVKIENRHPLYIGESDNG